ncbi:MAG: GDYXXLXY domain-containing protein [Brevibacillus sp.]|nr:GDYXXLXY domain-containing protein [Brevibacillus sp.]
MKKRFALLVLLQVVLLLSVAGKYYWIVATGQTVTLKTAPIDPRDLFYGDYVQLGFDVNRLDLANIRHDLVGPLHDEQVYVVLEKRGNAWHEAVGVFRSKPELTEGQAMLRGHLHYYNGDGWRQTVRIEYGIERYYVPEKTGRDIEQAGEQPWFAELRVSSSGEAVLSRLYR